MKGVDIFVFIFARIIHMIRHIGKIAGPSKFACPPGALDGPFWEK
jgi:hypothetical protein